MLEAVTTAPTAPTTPAAAWPTPGVVLGIVAVGAAALREVHNLLLHNWLGPLGHPGGLRLLCRPGGWRGRRLSRQRISLGLRFRKLGGTHRSGRLRRLRRGSLGRRGVTCPHGARWQQCALA